MRGRARHLTGWIPVVACLLLGASVAFAATINVPGQYAKIQDAIGAAKTGDVVMVAPGTYKELIFFNGKAITVQSTNPTNASVVAATIISGDGKESVVHFFNGETRASVLSGFTITNGTGMSTGGSQIGGGICCKGASPTITYCVLVGNSARDAGGGGIEAQEGSSPLIANNEIRGNTAGGGIVISGGSPIIRGNRISGNVGVGVWVVGCTALVEGNLVQGNTLGAAKSFGGGIALSDLTNATGLVSADNSVVRNNLVVANALAGIYASGTDQLVSDTVVGNPAGTSGDAVHVWSLVKQAKVTIVDCIITSSTGNGVLLSGGTVSVTYSDVFGNKGGDYSGGAAAGTGSISVDPLFANAAKGDYRLKSCNGRWTGTAWLRDFVTSPCIDAGDPATAVGQEPTPNDGIINLGFDGGTQYASKSSMVAVMSFAYPSNTKPWRPWGWAYKWPVDHASAEAHITLRPAISRTAWGAPLAATFHWTGNALTFVPTNFAGSSRYLLTLARGVAKTAGGTIGWEESWAFSMDSKGWPVFDSSFAQ